MRFRKSSLALFASMIALAALTVVGTTLPASAAAKAKGLPATTADEPPYVCKPVTLPNGQPGLNTKCVQTIPGTEEQAQCITVQSKTWGIDIGLYVFNYHKADIPVSVVAPEEQVCSYRRTDTTNVYVFDKNYRIVKKKLKEPVTTYTKLSIPQDVFKAGAKCQVNWFQDLFGTATPSYGTGHGAPFSQTWYTSDATCATGIGIKVGSLPVTPVWKTWTVVHRDYKLDTNTGSIFVTSKGTSCEFTRGWCSSVPLEYHEYVQPR
jgi:hypothetical protein